MEEAPEAVGSWSEVYLTNQTMFRRIFPSANSKLLKELKDLVQKVSARMKPEDWLKCLRRKILYEWVSSDRRSGVISEELNLGQLPAAAAEVFKRSVSDQSRRILTVGISKVAQMIELFQTVMIK